MKLRFMVDAIRRKSRVVFMDDGTQLSEAVTVDLVAAQPGRDFDHPNRRVWGGPVACGEISLVALPAASAALFHLGSVVTVEIEEGDK